MKSRIKGADTASAKIGLSAHPGIDSFTRVRNFSLRAQRAAIITPSRRLKAGINASVQTKSNHSPLDKKFFLSTTDLSIASISAISNPA